jgi:hypothetical protein
MLPNDVARCLGHGAGPQGFQVRGECVNCQRRLAPRPAGMVPFINPPPAEFPCPKRIPEVVDV